MRWLGLCLGFLRIGIVVDDKISWADNCLLGTFCDGNIGLDVEGCNEEGPGRRGVTWTREAVLEGTITGSEDDRSREAAPSSDRF